MRTQVNTPLFTAVPPSGYRGIYRLCAHRHQVHRNHRAITPSLGIGNFSGQVVMIPTNGSFDLVGVIEVGREDGTPV